MELEATQQSDEAQHLRPSLIPVRQVFTADQQTLFGKGEGDGLGLLMRKQGLEGLNDKLIAALHLRVGGRIQTHGPQGGVQADRKIKKQCVSLR